MKKDTYMTLLGLRDTCYNDFNFDIDEKDFYLGTDTYKKIDKILKDAQDEQLLVQFEEGTHLYQDYDPEYLSVAQKREIQHDINAARNFLDNYDGDVDDKHDNYAAYLDDNSLSYSFGPDSNLDEVQNNLNDIETNGVIIWQRRKDECILLPHTIHSLERIKKQIASSKRVDDKKLRYAMERLFDNITDFLKPFSDSELGKYESSISQELRDNLEHYALSVQTDAREVAADKLTKYAVQLAKKKIMTVFKLKLID